MVRSTLIATWQMRSYAKVYGLLVVLAVVYGYIIFAGPVVDVAGNEKSLRANIIIISLVMLQAGMWMLAARGALATKSYAESIKGSEDEPGLRNIAQALSWLVAYMVTLSLFGALVTFNAGSEALPWFVALRNHAPLIIMLISTFYLYRGARQLRALATDKAISQQVAVIVSVVFALCSALFIIRFFSDRALSVEATIPHFAISMTALFFTYIFPYLLVWLLGVVSMLNVARYSSHVQGAIYRQLFKNLYRGVSLVFICIFLAQLIMASSVDVSSFNLTVASIYIILLAATYGFLLIYRGVRSLSLTESNVVS